jgi:hypothetical protein
MINKNNETILENLIKYVEQNIFSNLPEDLFYHCADHTLKDVLPHVEELAKKEHLGDNDLFILKIAALFHDTGFVESYSKNEPIGAKIAEKVLSQFDFTIDQIDTIKKIILATTFNNDAAPHLQLASDNLMEQIICDADLDNLGRDDFFDKSDALRKELSLHGLSWTDKDWIQHQISLLNNHAYYTKSAQQMRNSGKIQNLEKLKVIFSKL